MYQNLQFKIVDYFIPEYFKCLLRTFWAQFWVLGVKSKHKSKIFQIHLEKNLKDINHI